MAITICMAEQYQPILYINSCMRWSPVTPWWGGHGHLLSQCYCLNMFDSMIKSVLQSYYHYYHYCYFILYQK